MADGILVAPWGAIARAAGLRATFDPGRQTLRLVSASATSIIITPGADFQMGDRSLALPVAAQVGGQDIVAPVKPLADALDWVLDWNDKTRTASLWGKVLAVVTRGDDRGVAVSVVTSLPVKAQETQLIDPIRTVVDLPGVFMGQEPPVNYVNFVGVQRLRVAQFESKPPLARLVADLSGNGPRGTWEAREDGCGGRIVFGKPSSSAAVIERPRPRLLKIAAASHGPDDATFTFTLSDPVAPIYDVLRKPYRVLLDLGGAEMLADPATIPLRVSLVSELRLVEEGRLALYMHELVPFSFRTLTKPDRLILTFQRDRIAGKKIVVDAGHGGKDSGARGRTLLEKNINLDVARRTVTRLGLMDAKPILTRDNDTFVDLYDRPRMTNALRADLFVSIHCNAFKWDTGWGTQTYYCTPQSKGLAVALHDALWPGLQRKDGGVHQARFCVIRETEIPAVLVELLFIDHKVEEGLLAKPETRQAAANGICEGLRRYLEGTSSLPPAILVPPTETPGPALPVVTPEE
jgi:N-acetylmuramoyl-L-alanine amidase